jgi:DinB family protein
VHLGKGDTFVPALSRLPIHFTESAPADVNDVLADHRAAVLDLVAAAERSAVTWTTPRAPGKWSPSQVVEHVARGVEEAAAVVSGAPSIPMPRAFLRPLLRLFFYRILKKDAFPTGFKAHQAMNPPSGSATPADARVRLEGALARFEQECRRRTASGQHVVSTAFGTVPIDDFVRYCALHTRHHCKQMRGAT